MNNHWEEQKKRISKASQKLRRDYYQTHGDGDCYFESPHGTGGNLSESIGAWPEFIFRGTFCKRTFKGYCSPCFYSQFPIENKERGDSYKDMIRHQFDYVINNFDELVVQRQYGVNRDSDNLTFVLIPTGSYFDEEEFPQQLRIEMLQKLSDKSKEINKNLHLLIECHCLDWLSLDSRNKWGMNYVGSDKTYL